MLRGKVKVLLLIVLIILSVSMLFQQVFAEDPSQDFQFNSSTGTITKYIGNSENVNIPSTINGINVVRIGSEAFEYCKSITSITIPNGVISIGREAFNGCSNLTSITIPDSVTIIDDGAFRYCGKLASITIPNGVTSINNELFSKCYGLKSIILPNSITTIGFAAFDYCSRLGSIEIPNSVTSINDYTFVFCRSLIDIRIPSSVTSIGKYAFYDCSSLTKIRIPSSVTSIGSDVFKYCDGLTIYTATGSIADIYAKSNSIPVVLDFVFNSSTGTIIEYNGNGGNVIIPSKINGVNVTQIGNGAFSGCSLTNITIPSSITSIGYSAFDGCNNLTITTIRGSAADTYAKSNSIPVSYLCMNWMFNENDGNIAKDFYGYFDGILSNTMWDNGSIKLDGSNGSFVNLGKVINLKEDDFTISFWVRTTEKLRLFDLFGNRIDGSHGNFFSIRMTGAHESVPEGTVILEVDENGSGLNYVGLQSSKVGLNDGIWHNIVASRKGTTLKLYVDGSLSSQGISTGKTNITNTNDFKFGRSLIGWADRFSPQASFDDLKVYSSCLTDNEISALYSNRQ